MWNTKMWFAPFRFSHMQTKIKLLIVNGEMKFIKLFFASISLDGINFDNILYHKSVQLKKKPLSFTDQSVPILYYNCE